MINRKKKIIKKSMNPLIFSLRCALFPLAMTQANVTLAMTEPTGQQDSFAKAAIQGKASCGKSIVLDGVNDWVNIPDMELSGNFTVEAWIKLAPGIDNKDAILGQEGSGPDINFYGGKARLFVPFADHITAKTAVKPDTWTHIAITRSGSNLSLYINGILDSTGVWNGKFPVKALGRGNISSRGTFKGEMDEVRIWSLARSGKQINNSIKQSVAPDSQGLVGYWTFNEIGQSIIDSSKLGRHGTLGLKNVEGNDDPIRQKSTAPINETCAVVQDTSTTDTAPKPPVVAETKDTTKTSCGMGLALDGKDDWVNIPDIEFPGNFTIEAWTKLAPGIDNKDAIVGQEGRGPDINFYSSKVRLYVPFTDHVTANSTVRPDTWTHIALSRSGSNLSLYVNGILDSIGTWNGKFPVKALGRGNVSTSGTFQGELDEVRFWNLARTGSQINNSYDQSVAADSQGLVGYWTFNETSQAASDSSKSGYHGVLGATKAVGNDDPKHVKSSAPINENCDLTQNQAPAPTVVPTPVPVVADNTPTTSEPTVNNDNAAADQTSSTTPDDSASSLLSDSAPDVQGTTIVPSTVIYVSTQGNDSNPGTLASPFKTLAKARATVQQIKSTKGLPAKGIAVVLRKGTYYLEQSFKLGASDSGTSGKPVIYTSYPGEQAIISGAKGLNSSLFKPVTNFLPVWNRLDTQARSKILYTDLKQHGISNFGQLNKRGTFGNDKGALHLFFDNKPMTLARWPDKPTEASPKNHSASESGFTHINKALSNTSFSYTDARASRWTQAKDIWLHGFFKWNWADFHIPVTSLNTGAKIMNVGEPQGYGMGNGQPFYAYNLMEEITQPGEWYLDRSTGILYFWAPADIRSKSISVSMLETNLIEMNNTSFITIKDIVLEGSRDSLITINGGSNNIIDHSILRNAGNVAASINGTNSGIKNSTIAYTGNGSIIVKGGNRVKLTSANNFVRNNEIHHFGSWVYGYKPAVKAEGVGQKISHNLMYQGPHAAVVWDGNEHLMEYNEIHDVTRFSQDMGAFYAGRDWSVRGNVIRYNFIHNLYSWAKHGEFDVHGVYLDDNLSGNTVFGNVFYGIEGFGILSGGGRDNIMENNIFAYCGVPLFTDNRGVNQINFTPGSSWNLIERIAKAGIDYKANPWASKYPALAAVPKKFSANDKNNHWLYPEGSVYSRNISIGGNPHFKGGIYDADFNVGVSAISYYKEVKDNKAATNPLFVNEAALNLNLKSNSPAFSIPGFKAIPFNQIGIQ